MQAQIRSFLWLSTFVSERVRIDLSSEDTLFTPPSVYAISFLFTLNTRKAIRGRGTSDQEELTENSKSWHIWMTSTNRQPKTQKSYIKDFSQINGENEVYGLPW